MNMIVPLTGAPPVVTYTQYNMKQCIMKQYSVKQYNKFRDAPSEHRRARGTGNVREPARRVIL
jgi:hypothetical protein